MFFSCFVVIDVLYIFIFVCTSVGLLPPGESPIAVNNNINNNNNNNKQTTTTTLTQRENAASSQKT
jgi:hypothetical protein